MDGEDRLFSLDTVCSHPLRYRHDLLRHTQLHGLVLQPWNHLKGYTIGGAAHGLVMRQRCRRRISVQFPSMKRGTVWVFLSLLCTLLIACDPKKVVPSDGLYQGSGTSFTEAVIIKENVS